MTCKDCETHIYNMPCLNCAARHCRMIFYPQAMSKWAYVEAVAHRYGHDKKQLAEKVKELGNASGK
jgi:hypothetical protein